MEDCRITQIQEGAHVKSKVKVMLIAFFDQKGTVHYEFVPEDETVNQHFSFASTTGGNCGVTSHGFSTITIAPAHKAISVRKLSAKKQITALDHPSLFPIFSALCLLAYFQAEGCDERNPFLISRRDHGLCDEGAEETKKREFYQVIL